MAGHLGILGNRQDVLDSKEYTLDVKATIENVVKTASPDEIFGRAAKALEGRSNSDLSYGYFLETLAKQCGSQIIDKWKDRLAGVDVWADGHCEVALIHTLLH